MLETAFTLPFWFEFAATVTGGLSGGMSAVRARYDIFGTVAIACITGMGGGIIRDILLQNYGLYAFLDVVPSIILGTITAIGGGISRDVLMNRPPVAFQTGPIYGSAALIGCIVYCPLKANGILPDSAGFLCAALIMALRYLSLIMGWRTKPPRDYSDRVVESVVRPARFIARKVHVPMGKTARERQGNTRLERFRRQGKRLYDRLSGRWMDETGEQMQPTVLMDKLELPVVEAPTAGRGTEVGSPDPSDRLFVDPEPEPSCDPFEPQTPEPARHRSKSQVKAGNPRARKKAETEAHEPTAPNLRDAEAGKDAGAAPNEQAPDPTD